MGLHKGNQGGRPLLNGQAMTEQLFARATPELAKQIDLRCNARRTPLDRAAMIRYLIELGIEADIRKFKVTD